jgi:hypothetical protein
MKPYEQGGLDGLCAIYSIVNAVRIVSSISDAEAKNLFRRILEHLERTHDLSRMLAEGIGLVTIGGIFRKVVKGLIPYRSMPFKNLPDTPLDEFWTEMTRFLETDGERTILIGLGGPMCRSAFSTPTNSVVSTAIAAPPSAARPAAPMCSAPPTPTSCP